MLCLPLYVQAAPVSPAPVASLFSAVSSSSSSSPAINNAAEAASGQVTFSVSSLVFFACFADWAAD